MYRLVELTGVSPCRFAWTQTYGRLDAHHWVISCSRVQWATYNYRLANVTELSGRPHWLATQWISESGWPLRRLPSRSNIRQRTIRHRHRRPVRSTFVRWVAKRSWPSLTFAWPISALVAFIRCSVLSSRTRYDHMHAAWITAPPIPENMHVERYKSVCHRQSCTDNWRKDQRLHNWLNGNCSQCKKVFWILQLLKMLKPLTVRRQSIECDGSGMSHVIWHV